MKKISLLGIVLSLILVIGVTAAFTTAKINSIDSQYSINANGQTNNSDPKGLNHNISSEVVSGSFEIEDKAYRC